MAMINLSVVSTPRHHGTRYDSGPAGIQGPGWAGPALARGKLWMGGFISELAHTVILLRDLPPNTRAPQPFVRSGSFSCP